MNDEWLVIGEGGWWLVRWIGSEYVRRCVVLLTVGGTHQVAYIHIVHIKRVSIQNRDIK